MIGSGGRLHESVDMKIFVPGVGGQLGHDVVNDAMKRGHEVVGLDIAEKYSGVQDGSPVCSCSYRQLDITDQNVVKETVERIHTDAIIHCAAWTAVDAGEDEENCEKVDRFNHLGIKYIDKHKK